MQPTVLYITGVSGSGKTTLGLRVAQVLGYIFTDADDFHSPANIAKMRSGQPLDDTDRADWLAALSQHVQAHLAQRKSVVVACSALRQKYRNQLATDQPGQVRWVHLTGSFDLILARIAARKGHYMPPDLLRSQFDAWEQPTEGLTLDIKNKPEALVNTIIQYMSATYEFGLVGLGVMGRSLARNLARRGTQLALYNRHVPGKEERVAAKAVEAYPELGSAAPFEDLEAFVGALRTPRRIFLMVDAGPAVDAVLTQILPLLAPDDIVMDGGNSHFNDTEQRAERAATQGVHYLGVGVSGGESGALNGPAIMVGGTRAAYAQVEPYLSRIAARDVTGQACLGHIGAGGAGHFVKMVHNGIEYAEMQLLAEAYSALRRESGFAPDEVATHFDQWRTTALRSYLLDISAVILRVKEGDHWMIDLISDKTGHKGTGSWATVAACELGVASTLMTTALFARYHAAQRDERIGLAKHYTLPAAPSPRLDPNALRDALQLARIINHYEGFRLIRAASEQFGWQVDLPDLARIWTNGCIIRSELLVQAMPALQAGGDLLLHPDFMEQIKAYRPALQQVVAALTQSGRGYPCLSAALQTLNSLTTEVSSGHMIQAQRDFFGAHTFERVDDASGKKYHHQWPEYES
jgi:6-phosphogluconate dehydrogenase